MTDKTIVIREGQQGLRGPKGDTGDPGAATNINSLLDAVADYAIQFNMYLGENIGTTGSTGNRNTATGVSAFQTNTTGSLNVAYGTDTLKVNTIGDKNTAIGSQALDENTTGTDNTAIGWSALDNCTTGIGNTALGSGAGFNLATENSAILIGQNVQVAVGVDNYLNIGNVIVGDMSIGDITLIDGFKTTTQAPLDNSTKLASTAYVDTAITSISLSFALDDLSDVITVYGNASMYLGQNSGPVSSGNNNTALGVSTLQFNTTGIDNTAIGTGALGLNNGSNNTALGVDALGVNTTGNYNTAVGVLSLTFNDLGQYNTAVGFEALKSTLADHNTAIGRASLRDNSSGLGNTSVGSGALIANTTGNNNTAIGIDAGSNILSGDNNILIGHQTYTPLPTTSNYINIGDTILGDRLTGDVNIIGNLTALNLSGTNTGDDPLSAHDTDDLVEGITNLYYTAERAQDDVFNAIVDSTTIDFTYNDAGNSFTGIVIDDSIDNLKLANMPTQTFKGRVTAGTGDPEDLTVTQMKISLGITNKFISTNQAIISAGALTISHSLGTQPFLIQVYLINIIAELGYTIGDNLLLGVSHLPDNKGLSIVPDATNLNIRFGTAASVLNILNKTTGASTPITNANWEVKFVAIASAI